MADGNIRITLDARQAKVMAQQLEDQLKSLDSQAQRTQASTDKMSSKNRQSADSYKRLVTSVNQLVISVRQLGQHTENSRSSMAQLSSSLRQLMQSNQVLVATINNATAALNNLRNAQASASAGAQNASSSISQMGSTMERTGGIANSLKAILATFGTALSFQYAAKTLMDFDHAMAQVEAISRATGVQLDALREKAKQLGATTIYTSGEAATGMKYLAQSGFDVNEILTATSSVLALAQAGDIGLAQASEIAAKALRGFRLDASQMSDVADVMAAAVTQSTMNIQEMGYAFKYVAPIAASMGVSMREASAYIGVLSDAGIDATMAGTALRRIMSEISNPTIKATKLLEAHGLTMADVNIKTLGLTKVMENLVNANLSVGETFALFGDRGAPAFQTLAQQIDVVKQKHQNLMDVQGRAAKMQEVMNKSLFAAFKNLTSAIEFLIIQFSESSGILNGLKAAMFGLAEGIRFIGRNLQYIAPIITAIVLNTLPRMLTSLFAIKVASTQTATSAVASWTAIGASAKQAGVSIATTARSFTALKAATAGLVASLGGIGTIILSIVSGVAIYGSQVETFAYKASTAFEGLLDVVHRMREGKAEADEFTEALKKQQEQINKMSFEKAKIAFTDAKDMLKGLKNELNSTFQAIRTNSGWESFGDLYGDGAKQASEGARKYVTELNKIKEEWDKLESQGKLTSAEMARLTAEVEKQVAQLPENERQLRANGEGMIELMDKTTLAQMKIEQFNARLNGMQRAANAAKRAIEALGQAMADLPWLEGKQLSNIVDATAMSKYNAETQKVILSMGAKKGVGKMIQKQRGTLATEVGPDALKYLNMSYEANGRIVVALKNRAEITQQATQEAKALGKTDEEAAKAAATAGEAYDKRIKAAQTELPMVQKRLDQQHEELTLEGKVNEMYKNQTKSGGGAAKAAKAQAKALNTVNMELARMTMTDREVQQLRFEQELAKLEKTLGKTNPQFQQLVQLWEKAKALGLSSPKEIMNAKTSFEDWMQIQAHGGDRKWNEKAKVDAQAQYLEQLYKGDAEKSVQIAQWAADRKREITSGSIAKDTQSLLKFWEDYINISVGGEEQYSMLLNQYYQERYNAYLALCNNEVAARAKAEDDKLRKSRAAIDGIKVATRDWITENTNMAKQMGELTTTIYDGIADAMYNMVATGKMSWEELGKTIIAELTKMIIKTMILANLMKLIGLAFNFNANTAGAEESLMTQPGFFAKGGVVSGISGYSNSVVSSPTMFSYGHEVKKFAKGTALMGEAGSEAIMPLARDRRGRLGVRAQDGGNGGGQAPVVNISIVNTTGQKVSTQSKTDNNGNQSLEVMVGDMAAQQMLKTGTALNKAARSFSGVSQQVTRR